MINSNIEERAQTNRGLATTNQFIEKPLNCLDKCKNNSTRCTEEPYYSLGQLRTPQLVNKRLLEDELQRHRHPKSRLVSRNRTQRNIEEGKQELIDHYLHDFEKI